jgi:hypothetical protein
MNMSALLETLLSTMIIPLFVLGVLAILAVIVLVIDKKILRR